jgi:hypothetical protein
VSRRAAGTRGAFVRSARRGLRALAADERGAEQMDYLLIFAAVVLPMALAARLLWSVLLYYFTVEAFVVDMPLF